MALNTAAASRFQLAVLPPPTLKMPQASRFFRKCRVMAAASFT